MIYARKLNSVQQKALKSVFLLPYRSHVTQRLPAFNIIKVEQIITSVRAKFIHNLRKGRLPTEFGSFALSVNLDDENNRSSRFSGGNNILPLWVKIFHVGGVSEV